jgi:hypothetical protein
MAQYDVGMKYPTETDKCFQCGVVVEPFIFLCEACKSQREAEDGYDLKYKTWERQKQPGERFGQWLVRRRRGNGEGMETGSE